MHFEKLYKSLCNCLYDKLLLVKPHMNDFSLGALRLVGSYLTNRRQRIKEKNIFSKDFQYIFVTISSLWNKSIAIYADDNTHYVTVKNVDNDVKPIEENSSKLFQWFPDNQTPDNQIKTKNKIL